ncbi:MAG: hypothetical protein HFG04_06110 [Oscillibacter sp.]|nr:hypothetical protein [Oscillibacter sp.]
MAQKVPALPLRNSFQKLRFPFVIIRSRLDSPIRRLTNHTQALAGKEIRVVFDLVDSGTDSGLVEPGEIITGEVWLRRERHSVPCQEEVADNETRHPEPELGEKGHSDH